MLPFNLKNVLVWTINYIVTLPIGFSKNVTYQMPGKDRNQLCVSGGRTPKECRQVPTPFFIPFL